MIVTFFSHIRKSFLRSSSVGKDAALQVTLALIFVIAGGYTLQLGFALENIIVNTSQQKNAVQFLNSFLIYYFIAELTTRYFIQQLPALYVQPYLHLPVARSKIVNFLLVKSLIHPLNVFVFILFTPFAFTAISTGYGTGRAWVWLLSLWIFSLINHFLVILVKRNFMQRVRGLVALLVMITFFAGPEYFGWFKLSTVSEGLFTGVLEGYVVISILCFSIIIVYYVAYCTFRNSLYSEGPAAAHTKAFRPFNWGFFQKSGLTGLMGAWIEVELKLIFRNRRSRELFLLHITFLLLAFAFYSYIKDQGAYGIFLFLGIICSGCFIMNYGQFLFSWQGGHFDFTLTQPTSIRLFVESKYWLLSMITILWFLVSISFVYLGWKFLLVNLVSTLYNIGINIFVVMNMSMWGAKRIDLRHPGSLNLEGLGAAQWIMGFPLILSPYVLFIPFKLAGYPMVGLVSVGIAGLVGIAFRKKLIQVTSQRLFDLRYVMASSFRND